MKEKTITVPVRLDAKTFRRFCRFDMLRLRRKWIRPAAFAGILVAFAAVALLSGKAQAGMIAAVLLVVGLGLPIVYVGSFLTQINLQVSRNGLDSPRAVYTVRLSERGIRVTNDQREEPPQEVPWKGIQAAFRAKDCVYLYVNAARAFLLPDGQADAPAEAVWAFIQGHLGAKARAL